MSTPCANRASLGDGYLHIAHRHSLKDHYFAGKNHAISEKFNKNILTHGSYFLQRNHYRDVSSTSQKTDNISGFAVPQHVMSTCANVIWFKEAP